MISIEELYSLYKKCTGISTDSRSVSEGAMFFALKGDKFDGNDYAVNALKSGARYAVVDRVSLEGSSFKNRKCIVVENALEALNQLAALHRKQYDIPVIGITGTNGKTTTKELIAAVLKTKYNVLSTKANFNNHIGVPLTLMGIDEHTEVAVVEMGASAPGEIASLVKVVNPTHGLITSVGKAHLQGFGSFEGVKIAKGELYDYLRQTGGLALYNADNEHLTSMVSHRPGIRAQKYGIKFSGSRILPSSPDTPFLSLSVNHDGGETPVNTKLVGTYNADNVMAALAVAQVFEVPFKAAVKAIEDYNPSNNRSQLLRTQKNILIIDAYNANPSSMTAALDNFATMEFGNKTLILGDMLELGEESAAEHSTILQKASAITDSIYLVGEEFGRAAKAVRTNKVRCFSTVEDLRVYLGENPLAEQTILIKGSNGIHLQSLPEIL